MKKIILNCSILLAIVIVVQSCRPDKVPTLKPATSTVSGFAGTWKLTQVTESDGNAVANKFTYQTMDITNAFPYNTFSLILNMNDSTPTTFSTVQGTAPKVIPITGGNWLFDNPNYPSVITFTNGTDTSTLTINAYPTVESPQLDIALNKYAVTDTAKKSVLITYNYLFTKQQ